MSVQVRFYINFYSIQVGYISSIFNPDWTVQCYKKRMKSEYQNTGKIINNCQQYGMANRYAILMTKELLQYQPIQAKANQMSEALQREIINRVKRIKCHQPDCRSDKQQTLQVAVVGDGNYKRKGIMCTSCFIDQQLISSLGNVELHTLSIQKFLKVLTENYGLYAQEKMKPDWPPAKMDKHRQQIRKQIKQLQYTVTRGILDVMKFLEDGMKQATEKAKKVNHDKNLEKLLQLINEEDDNEQQRINVTNQIKDMVSKLVKQHGQYKLSTEEDIKKQNQLIMIAFRKKAMKAKDTIIKLVQIHKKCLKHLIQ